MQGLNPLSLAVKAVWKRCSAAVAGVFATLLVGAAAVPVYANPLDSTWTQVGFMSPDGSMFNGNCDLDLSGCAFSDGTDFWQPFGAAHEILFITTDGMYWGQARYSDVADLVEALAGDFAPNLQWINAGKAGVDVGSIKGNILMRYGAYEDPWVTLEGSHCAHLDSNPPCSEVIWGESAWGGSPVHVSLMTAHGGMQVYARSLSASLLSQLLKTLDSFNLAQAIANSLKVKLKGGTCGPLGAFINEVNAQSGKALTATQAQQLLTIATQLRTGLACK